MGTYLIIDTRKRQVRGSLDDAPGDETTIVAVDLINDTWDDFGYFSAQSAHYEEAGELRKRNRYMRAAIAFLFSHFDGVVSELFDRLRKEVAFKPFLPSKPDHCSLKDKVLSLQSFLAKEKGVSLPNVDLDMKLLRDIVNHPSITKKPSSAGGNDTLLYDGADVYGVAHEDLNTTALAIDAWLNAACGALGYERFRDTESLCEELANALGEKTGPVREF